MEKRRVSVAKKRSHGQPLNDRRQKYLVSYHVVEEVHHRVEVAGAGVHLHLFRVEVLERGVLLDAEALLEVLLVYRVNLLGVFFLCVHHAIGIAVVAQAIAAGDETLDHLAEQINTAFHPAPAQESDKMSVGHRGTTALRLDRDKRHNQR